MTAPSRRLLTAGTLALCLLALSLLVDLDATRWIDRSLLQWVITHRAPVQGPMRWVTLAGGSMVLVPVTAIVGFQLSRRARSWTPLVVLVSGYAATALSYTLLKALVARPRPMGDAIGVALPDSAAFPSGHAAQSLVVALLVAAVARPMLATSRTRWLVAALPWAATTVGISRVVLGVHWPSDVVGGWVLAGFWALLLVPMARERPAPAPRDRPVEVVVVRNPHAGSSRAGSRAVARLRQLDGVHILAEVVVDGDLRASLGQAVAALPDGGTLAVAGGDGSVGASAAILAGRTLRLAILPAGTGNDIARQLGIPLQPELAAEVAAGSGDRQVDLGTSDHGDFLHVLSLGVATEFAALVRDISGWRRPVAYPRAAIRAWRRRRPLDLTVTVDGHRLRLPSGVVQVALINSPRLGGRVGMDLPGATIDDGVLHLLAIRDDGLARWLRDAVLDAVVPQRRHRAPSLRGAVTTLSGRRFEITAATPVALSLDGEPAGHTPVIASTRPSALRVAVPEQLAARRRPTRSPARGSTDLQAGRNP